MSDTMYSHEKHFLKHAFQSIHRNEKLKKILNF
jgi:hypothetical protein